MDNCPICLCPSKSIFTNTTCSHSWCKQCHNKLIQFKHTSCPLCREDIHLKRRPVPKNEYIDWLLEGGVPVIRWRNKRWTKRLRWRR